jgi:ubiquinone/menaquinone biosynthesis C-methylase UbiE
MYRRIIHLKHCCIALFILFHFLIPEPCFGAEDTLHHSDRHHSFEEIEKWISLFEDPERRTWQKPDEVVNRLKLKPGDVIADIGAGTGYFTRLFAVAVGPKGKALGLDTEPAMVEYMRKDAEKKKLKNYIPVIVEPYAPGLDPGSADVIFICDTLHHIDDRVNYLRRIAPSLRPDGRIVVVDFYKKPLPVGPPLWMKLKKEEVIEEFQQAGYRLTNSHDILPYQYFLEFSL